MTDYLKGGEYLKPRKIHADRPARELQIEWADGHRTVYDFTTLRWLCPCASCRGEAGQPGWLDSNPTLSDEQVTLSDISLVGHYALQPIWADGHGTGFYHFERLREECPCPDVPAAQSSSGKQPGRVAAASARVNPRRKTGADPTPPRAVRRESDGSTPKEHRAWGRAIRDDVPREAFGAWAPADDRPDPVALLLEQSAARVPDLVPIRHGRMLVSPFTFYRGAALVMAADLARVPSSGIYVQACGDAHLSNFGMFATPERTMAFDVNDFDETHPAPFEWDVMRLVASIVVAADDNGFDRKTGRRLAEHAVRRYREQVATLSEMLFLDVWYSHVDIRDRIQTIQETYTKAQRKRVAKSVKKAERKTNVGALERLAERVDGKWRITEDPPLIVRGDLTPEGIETLRAFFGQYIDTLPNDLLPLVRHYKVVDFARKVVGVGSVGTEAHIALLIGTRGDDALFLQMKEATDSVLERYTISDLFKHQGERVVFGQRLMQASSDLFLGHASSPTSLRRRVDFYVRQLNDYKSSADIAAMDESSISGYVEVCAETLARAHARSGSANAISGYLGKGVAFDEALGSFAVAYADQNRKDHKAFARAGKENRMEVVSGI